MRCVEEYLREIISIAEALDRKAIEEMVDIITQIRSEGGRLFFLGVGGGAGNASHAVNDFRKIAGVESYSPCDNVSELTARTNDDGWESVFVQWLIGSKLNHKDGVFVLSVGGGNLDKNVRPNLVRALEYAQMVGAKILGIVGRDGGFTKKVSDACLVIPTVNSSMVTPHTESFQSIILHLMISHPKMQLAEMKWESIETKVRLSQEKWKIAGTN